jgi:putative membrane protein
MFGMTFRLSALFVLFSFLPIKIYSHSGTSAQSVGLSSGWATEPGAVFGIGLLASAYWLGIAELKETRRSGRAFRRRETWSFVAGCGALALALVSPLHPLGQILFSAHMVQHEVLMLIAAPLLVLSRPLPVFLIALPRSVRRPLVRIIHSGGWRPVTKFFSHAFVAWLLHAVILWTWHIPAAFSAAVETEWVHALQHVSFLGSAVLFWWAVFEGPNRKIGYGLAVLSVFTTALHSGVLGAMLTFASSPWYRPYLVSPFAWNITPLQDQQLGGLIMWIPASLVYVIAGLALFAGWLRESEDRAQKESLGMASKPLPCDNVPNYAIPNS